MKFDWRRCSGVHSTSCNDNDLGCRCDDVAYSLSASSHLSKNCDDGNPFVTSGGVTAVTTSYCSRCDLLLASKKLHSYVNRCIVILDSSRKAYDTAYFD